MNAAARLTRIERRLMAAEYLMDSTNTHVRMKNCGDVKPRALARYTTALSNLRAALEMVRNNNGARHPTLFAGNNQSGPSQVRAREAGKRAAQHQKSWGPHKTPHRWPKDCEGDCPRDCRPDFTYMDYMLARERERHA